MNTVNQILESELARTFKQVGGGADWVCSAYQVQPNTVLFENEEDNTWVFIAHCEVNDINYRSVGESLSLAECITILNQLTAADWIVDLLSGMPEDIALANACALLGETENMDEV